ncbi:transmembrane protein, putative [Medicago truncatula]|uniref:Transmembrane protein, putative n=1 Tax=Medicago truncatula TaxID=3880 RepID=A0A072UJ78_MEDTR|nr:transmembrane protein, putative [Medicago truncatula]
MGFSTKTCFLPVQKFIAHLTSRLARQGDINVIKCASFWIAGLLVVVVVNGCNHVRLVNYSDVVYLITIILLLGNGVLQVQCHECESYGHIRTECETFLKKQKKGMIVSWSDDEEVDGDPESDTAKRVTAMTEKGLVILQKSLN